MTLIDTVASVEGPTIHDDYQWMHTHIGKLDPVERKVLRMRFATEGKPSLAKVSSQLGLSKDKVQRIERNALAELRRRLEPCLNPPVC
jgi:DNA-directed RNA polymerase sigma subunit (sigma70/sigma32)